MTFDLIYSNPKLFNMAFVSIIYGFRVVKDK